MGFEQIVVRPVDRMGSDRHVVNAARVSFGKVCTSFDEKDERLIKYLAEHGHYSPFGHCFASFHVKAPIFVARQLVKHKFLRWNEISRRYVDDRPEFYIPDKWRGRAKDKKQGSEGYVGETDGANEEYEVSVDLALDSYRNLLDLGVAPEQARMVLPQSTMTEWYWSGSLDAFVSMYNLRAKPDSQEESRIVAEQIGEYLLDWFPVSFKELTDVS